MDMPLQHPHRRTRAKQLTHTARALRVGMLAMPALLLLACGGGSATTSATAPATGATSVSAAASGDVRSATSVQVSAAVLVRTATPDPRVVPLPQPNDAGSALTVSTSGTVDNANPFFKALGNGRACASCHRESDGWSITPKSLAARFTSSAGLDPVFRAVDGANSPHAPTATLAQKRSAYNMLLTKGLIRVGLPIPVGAEFTLVKTDDPYHFASASELSLFRRPLPSTNLNFISNVMWDARETASDAASANCIIGARPASCFASVDADLLHQANSAVRGHAEAAQDLSTSDQRAIVDFEKALFSAQSVSKDAGALTDAGALGGPSVLAQTGFYFGINDVEAGDYRSHAPFNRAAMAMFGAWRNLAAPPPPPPPRQAGGPATPPPPPAAPTAQNLARASIARGEGIFNNKPFNIVRVAGFSDELRLPLQRGSCTSCHSTPNVGSHSVARLFDTGVSAGALRTPDLPLYTLRNNATGETVDTSDPAQALVTGKWKDVGRVKVPGLRNLAARAPYFHNGSAADIEAVVRFYDRRFRIGYTPQEVADLSAFLKAL